MGKSAEFGFYPAVPPTSVLSLQPSFHWPRCFLVVIAGKSGARPTPPLQPDPPPSYTITSFLAPFHSSGSFPPPPFSLCMFFCCLAVLGNAAPVTQDCLLSHRGSEFNSELAIIRKMATHTVLLLQLPSWRRPDFPLPHSPSTFTIPSAYNLPGWGCGVVW